MTMPRYAKSRDLNENEIVKALRDIPGVSVYLIDTPCDAIVGYRAHNILLEIKQPGKEKRKDQQAQRDWRKQWQGQIQVVTTVDEAVHCVLNCYYR